jgi:phosphoenolpyruvate carboxykinase (GTP)
MAVDRDQAKKEARDQEDQFDLFFDRLPKEFTHHRELFKSRIWRSPKVWEMARAVF